MTNRHGSDRLRRSRVPRQPPFNSVICCAWCAAGWLGRKPSAEMLSAGWADDGPGALSRGHGGDGIRRYRKALTLGNLPETARDRIRAAIVDGGATGLR
jgi:hypothetical protein